jgi:hypothetical protein
MLQVTGLKNCHQILSTWPPGTSSYIRFTLDDFIFEKNVQKELWLLPRGPIITTVH